MIQARRPAFDSSKQAAAPGGWGSAGARTNADGAMALHMKGAPTSDSEALELFRSLDRNGDHVLTLEEFWHMARLADCPEDKLQEFVGSFDTDEAGVITEAEFLAFFRKMRSLAQKHRYEAALTPQARVETPTARLQTPTTPVNVSLHGHMTTNVILNVDIAPHTFGRVCALDAPLSRCVGQRTPRTFAGGGAPLASPRTPGAAPTPSFATPATPSTVTTPGRATPSSRMLVAGGRKFRPTAAALVFRAVRRILHSSLQSALASTVRLPVTD